MSAMRNGGAAFPLLSSSSHRRNEGMSLRDWFAGMAMQGLLAQGKYVSTPADAYKLADAMLEQREK